MIKKIYKVNVDYYFIFIGIFEYLIGILDVLYSEEK